MSLLLRIEGAIERVEAGRFEQAVERLCSAVLEHNRLAAGDVVAAEVAAPAGIETELLVAAARRSGWTGMPLFRSHVCADALEIRAHVRIRRKRRSRPLRLEQP